MTETSTKTEPGSIYPGADSRFGERLRWARQMAGITQTELAKKTYECQQSNVSKLERTPASGSMWTVHFARALGVDPWWLATGQGAPLRGAE